MDALSGSGQWGEKKQLDIRSSDTDKVKFFLDFHVGLDSLTVPCLD